MRGMMVAALVITAACGGGQYDGQEAVPTTTISASLVCASPVVESEDDTPYFDSVTVRVINRGWVVNFTARNDKGRNDTYAIRACDSNCSCRTSEWRVLQGGQATGSFSARGIGRPVSVSLIALRLSGFALRSRYVDLARAPDVECMPPDRDISTVGATVKIDGASLIASHSGHSDVTLAVRNIVPSAGAYAVELCDADCRCERYATESIGSLNTRNISVTTTQYIGKPIFARILSGVDGADLSYTATAAIE